MKRAVVYVEAIRFLVGALRKGLANQRLLYDVDYLAGTLVVGTIAELFEEDVRIVATDVVREVIAPGSVT